MLKTEMLVDLGISGVGMFKRIGEKGQLFVFLADFMVCISYIMQVIDKHYTVLIS